MQFFLIKKRKLYTISGQGFVAFGQWFSFYIERLQIQHLSIFLKLCGTAIWRQAPQWNNILNKVVLVLRISFYIWQGLGQLKGNPLHKIVKLALKSSKEKEDDMPDVAILYWIR